MKIATDHGFPKASFGGSDPNAFDAFKNERDYIAQGGKLTGTVAAMDWAAAEIERLRALAESRREEIQKLDNLLDRFREAIRPFAELAAKLDGAPNLVGLLTEADFKAASLAYSDEQSKDPTP